MCEAAMQEHVGQELIHLEGTGLKEVQSQQRVQVYATAL